MAQARTRRQDGGVGVGLMMRLLPIFLVITVLASCASSPNYEAGPPYAATDPNSCTEGYPEQTTSPYILPYAAPAAFVVGQGNCTDGSHEIGTFQAYAYDFDMPIGTDVVASMAGTVLVVVENFPENNGTPGEENYVLIQHSENLITGYYHLTQNGVVVEVGSHVDQGQIIGQSGNTGDSSEPHLHFEAALCKDCDTVPVTFRNTRAHANGLVEGENYAAERPNTPPPTTLTPNTLMPILFW